MAEDDTERGDSSLRGRLSEVYFPALLAGSLGPLAARLGDRASVLGLELGRATGLREIEAQLEKTATWLRGVGATYEAGTLTAGIVRDVSEGRLAASRNGATLEVPVAVVAERRKSREIDVRVYCATHLLGSSARATDVAPTGDAQTGLPSFVSDQLEAMRTGDVDAALAGFEEGAILRDALGKAHDRPSGALRAHLEKLVPWGIVSTGYTDDGRCCGCELFAANAKPSGAPLGLVIYERGDSGLIREARFYERS